VKADMFIKTCNAAIESVLRGVKSLYEREAKDARVIRKYVLYVSLEKEPRYAPDEVAIEDAYTRITSLAVAVFGIHSAAIKEEELFSFEDRGFFVHAKVVSFEVFTVLGGLFVPKFITVRMHLPSIDGYEYLVVYLGIDRHPVRTQPLKPKG